MIEFYTKLPGDTDFKNDTLEISNEFDAYILQIQNVFNGETGAVMGAEDMPIDLEQYVYERNYGEDTLRTKILQKLQIYCTFYSDFRTNVKVKFGKGTHRDICFIDLIITDKKGLSRNLGIFLK